MEKWLIYEIKNTTSKKLQQQTGIPVPLFKKLKRGKEINFSKKSLDKIKNNYNTKMQFLLQSKGVPEKDSMHYTENYTPLQVYDMIINADNVAKKIWKYKVNDYNERIKKGRTRGPDGEPLVKPLLKHIIKGLQNSSKILSDWVDMIVSYGKKK